MKIRVASYGTLIFGLLLIGLGVYFLLSYIHDQQILEEGGKIEFHNPGFKGRHGIIPLIIYIGLVKTWWTPLLIAILGFYMVYQTFAKKIE